MKNDEKQVLLDVKNLKKYFNVGRDSWSGWRVWMW